MLRFRVTSSQQKSDFTHAAGPIEFGRMPSETGERFVLQDRFASRRQLLVEETSLGYVRLQNLGSSAISLAEGGTLGAGDSQTIGLPLILTVGLTQIVIAAEQPTDENEAVLQTIEQPAHLRRDEAPASIVTLGGSPAPETLTHWFETLLSVQRSAVGSNEFYAETARAVVNLVGLDRGMILLREGRHWKVVASHASRSEVPVQFSQTVLNRVGQEKRTFYETMPSPMAVRSLANVEAYVASPIFDERDEVAGAVYGSRDVRSNSLQRGINPLEAQMVQLLAAAVSSGLARVQKEAEAARLHVQLEQFASPELARELNRNPNLLDASERQLTVLFSDVRGCSRISEQLGPADTYRLVRDVMDRLTGCILAQGGFIIHYSGDGLAAMWNAPTDQPDHSVRACRAALAMQHEMPALNEQWQQRIGNQLQIGIGINSGAAQVGNSGSRQRLQYAPLGHTVNLASRVEGATKQLGVCSLVTAATHCLLGDLFVTRRLCRVRVVGIEGAVELFELYGETADESWLKRRTAYENALALCESRQPEEARRLLEPLMAEPLAQSDQPTCWLWKLATTPSAADSGSIFQLERK